MILVIDSRTVTVFVPGDAAFTLDPGPDPKPGQVWKLNQVLDGRGSQQLDR